jgi:mycothiol synthase
MELTFRSFEDGDAAPVAALFNAMEVAVGAHPGFGDAMIRSFMAELGDVSLDSRCVIAATGEIVGFAAVESPPSGGYRGQIYGGVLPQWQDKAIGRDLLAWQLDRLAAIRRANGPQAEWSAESATNVKDTASIRLYERFQMSPRRYWFDMEASTKSAPAVDMPVDVRSVPFEAEHVARVHAAHMEAFVDHFGFQHRDFDDWRLQTVEAEHFRSDLSRVALDGDEIAAYVLSYDEALDERAYIGQVGTRPGWRRRGLAGALLADVLMAAEKAGKTTASLGVDADSPTGAVGVYERVGFAIVSKSVSYAKAIS